MIERWRHDCTHNKNAQNIRLVILIYLDRTVMFRDYTTSLEPMGSSQMAVTLLLPCSVVLS